MPSENCLLCGRFFKSKIKRVYHLKDICKRCFKWQKHKISQHNKRAKKKGKSGRLDIEDWFILLMQHNFSCAKCKEKFIHLTLDHKKAMFDGGNNLIENIQPLCELCHNKKSRKENRVRKKK